MSTPASPPSPKPPTTPPDIQAAITKRLRSAGCVFAEDEARLLSSAADTADEVDELVALRVAGEPLEYILGWAEFCGLRILVDRGVFVPRRRTEFLVHQATPLAPSPAVVLDLCCGSGAIGMAIASILDGVELHAVDIDPVSVACTRRNLAPASGQAYVGDLYAPLPRELRGRIDILVANAPYVPSDAIGSMPPEARDHEPRVALDGGPDGLDILRRIVAEAPEWLTPDGSLLFETSKQQAPHALETVAAHGLGSRLATSTELDATVVIATKPRRPARGRH